MGVGFGDEMIEGWVKEVRMALVVRTMRKPVAAVHAHMNVPKGLSDGLVCDVNLAHPWIQIVERWEGG